MRFDPVLVAECIPGQRQWQPRVAHEKPAADDEILGVVELEQEQAAFRQGTETDLGARNPEIDLVGRPGRQKSKPAGIRYAYVKLSARLCLDFPFRAPPDYACREGVQAMGAPAVVRRCR